MWSPWSSHRKKSSGKFIFLILKDFLCQLSYLILIFNFRRTYLTSYLGLANILHMCLYFKLISLTLSLLWMFGCSFFYPYFFLSYYTGNSNQFFTCGLSSVYLYWHCHSPSVVIYIGCPYWCVSLCMCTVKTIIDFPRYNRKYWWENVIPRGIFHVVSHFPLYFTLYRGHFDYLSNSVVPCSSLLVCPLVSQGFCLKGTSRVVIL